MSDKRPLNWSKVRGPRAWGALLSATALGAGLLPLAPGTWGTLVAIPLAYVMVPTEAFYRAALWLGLLALGTWASKVMDELMGSADNQNIVIDEVVGYGISAWTAGTDWRAIAIAFVAFRFFDMLKPWPIRLLDQWSKRKAGEKSGTASMWWGGFGVMADDVLAGIQALVVVILFQRYLLS